MDFHIDYDGDLLAGVDEVGRGPLLGPVVTAAVILDKNKPIAGLNDSKKLTPKKRLALYEEIILKAKAYAFGRAEADEIDSINILQASLLAMRRAVDNLPIRPEYIVVDGNQALNHDIASQAIVKGDSLVAEIQAASILAKVERDNEMMALDEKYPKYGFKSHKGYPTKAHLEAIAQLGLLPMYRKSYAPVRRIIEST